MKKRRFKLVFLCFIFLQQFSQFPDLDVLSDFEDQQLDPLSISIKVTFFFFVFLFSFRSRNVSNVYIKQCVNNNYFLAKNEIQKTIF
jgi:hypothetical protein